MLSSIFKVVDDVYSAADRKVGGIVDWCFCRNVSGWWVEYQSCWLLELQY
jgi:hypothetical protein